MTNSATVASAHEITEPLETIRTGRDGGRNQGVAFTGEWLDVLFPHSSAIARGHGGLTTLIRPGEKLVTSTERKGKARTRSCPRHGLHSRL